MNLEYIEVRGQRRYPESFRLDKDLDVDMAMLPGYYGGTTWSVTKKPKTGHPIVRGQEVTLEVVTKRALQDIELAGQLHDVLLVFKTDDRKKDYILRNAGIAQTVMKDKAKIDIIGTKLEHPTD